MQNTNFTEKALNIINKQGVKAWIDQRDSVNFGALRNGYCIDIEGCCEEDRCDCAKYRGMSDEEIIKKLNERKNERFNFRKV